MEFLKDLWLFMKERKKFWLAPVIIILLILGLLIVFGGASAIAPFIYTLFQNDEDENKFFKIDNSGHFNGIPAPLPGIFLALGGLCFDYSRDFGYHV